MAGIQDFISLASGQLGIGEDKAQSATKGVLQTLQGASDGPDFSKFLSAMPGAGDLLKGGAGAAAGGSSGGGGGGMMGSLGGLMGGGGGGGGAGGLMGSLGGAMGGKAGSALGILGALQGAGLDGAKGGQFLQMFVQFAKDKVGPGVLQAVLSKVPELGKLLG